MIFSFVSGIVETLPPAPLLEPGWLVFCKESQSSFRLTYVKKKTKKTRRKKEVELENIRNVLF